MDWGWILDFCVKFAWNGVIALVLGVISIFLGNAIPRRWIHYDRFPFRCYPWEREGKTYHFLGIEYWKNRLPDISVYVNSVFPKKVQPEQIRDSAYFVRFAKETCVAELVHFFLILAAPVYYLFNWDGDWGVGVMMIDIVVNLPFILVQRYNRPRFVRVIEHRKRAELRQKEELKEELPVL